MTAVMRGPNYLLNLCQTLITIVQLDPREFNFQGRVSQWGGTLRLQFSHQQRRKGIVIEARSGC